MKDKELSEEQIKKLFGESFLSIKKIDGVIFNADRTISLKLVEPLKYPKEDDSEAREYLKFSKCKAKHLKNIKLPIPSKDEKVTNKIEIGDNIPMISAFTREPESLIDEMDTEDFFKAMEIAGAFFSNGQKTT